MKALLFAASTATLLATSALAAPAPPPAPQTADVSGATESEVKGVAMIAAVTPKLSADAQPAITAAPDASAKRKAQYALDDKMEALFTATGVTYERYNALATQARSNQALATRIARAAPDDAAIRSEIQTVTASATALAAKTEAAANPAPSATLKAQKALPPEAANSAASAGAPASAVAIDPKTSPVDGLRNSPVNPPGVSEIK